MERRVITLCPECGKQFGPLDASCPDCGVELERFQPVPTAALAPHPAGFTPTQVAPTMMPPNAPGAPTSFPGAVPAPMPGAAPASFAGSEQEPTTKVPILGEGARVPGPGVGAPIGVPGVGAQAGVPAGGAASAAVGPNSGTVIRTGAPSPGTPGTPTGGHSHVFQYTARQSDGSVTTGVIEASSEQAAVAVLRARGLWVSGMQERGGGANPDAPSSNESVLRAMNSGVSLKASAFFFRQLGTMVRSGIPVGEALELLQRQTSNTRLRSVATLAARHCQAGGKLSEIMRRYPRIFPEAIMEMVAAGEESGHLDVFLERIADYLERQYQVASRIKGALTYPIFMLFAIIFIPNAPIWVLNGAGAYFQATFWWALAVILGIWGTLALFRLLMTSEAFAVVVDEVKLSLPLIGKVVRQFAIGKFGRTLAMLFGSGVPLSRGLDIAARSCGNRFLARKLKLAVPLVQGGGSLSEAIATTGCFPPTVLHVMATGEKTGNVDMMVTKIAEFAEADANTAVDQSVALILPICVIILGCIVLVIMVRFYTGYFNGLLNAT